MTRWPWHCGLCGSHSEAYTSAEATAALQAHFQLHANDGDPSPVCGIHNFPMHAAWVCAECAMPKKDALKEGK